MTADSIYLKTVGIVPARYDSTRLPGKLLSTIGGKPLIRYTYENALKAKILDQLIVATDDDRIFKAVQGFGGKVVMTSREHLSGTERAAEVIEKIDCDIVVNIQGDEPTINHDSIEQVTRLLVDDTAADMGTLAYPVDNRAELSNPHVVKVVLDRNGYALYFSRAMIPNTKTGQPADGVQYLHHVGLYSYRREALLRLCGLPQSPLEKAEELEQLRALENGFKIKVGLTRYKSIDVNTYEDLERVREAL